MASSSPSSNPASSSSSFSARLARIQTEMRSHVDAALATLRHLREDITHELESTTISVSPSRFMELNHLAHATRTRARTALKAVRDREIKLLEDERDRDVAEIRASRDRRLFLAAAAQSQQQRRRRRRMGPRLLAGTKVFLRKQRARGQILLVQDRHDKAIRGIEDGMEKYVQHRDVSISARQFAYFISMPT